MRRGLLLLLLLGLFLLALAWPPLLKGAVERALPLLGLQGRVEGISGHLLFGLRLKGVALEAEGLELWAEEVGLAYDLLGLLRRELPLSLTLKGARVRPTWEALLPQEPGPPPAFRVVFRSLRLEGVEVELRQGERLFLPPLRLSLFGENPYRFLARLPGGSFQGEARALAPDLAAWDVAFRGEVGGLAFFYEGLRGGRVEGVFRLRPSGMEGEARLRAGVVDLVGFRLTGVEGELSLEGDQVEARLRGVGLEGPLSATAQVDLRGERYRFAVEGRPRLPALARHYGLALPLEGDGRLFLEGEGWEAVRVRGRFEGEGRLLGEPFRHRGRLAFDQVFRLETQAEGRLFDREYALGFSLQGPEYRGSYRDTLGSRLRLEGEGDRLRVQGEAAWPRPLEGLAEVALRWEGGGWRLAARSPGVRLPLFPPLDLSGEAQGEGERVAGRFGPLRLSGTWGDLALSLDPTPLAVGSLEGRGRLLGGRLSAHLLYDSPYARFPVGLRQEAWGLSFRSPYGEGWYRGGALALRLTGLPIRALDEMRLTGEARYREGGLSGRLFLRGRYLEVQGDLRRLGADLRGRLTTPLGEVPLLGRYDPEPGLLLEGGGLRLTYREDLRLFGQGELGGVGLEADLSYRGGFSGWAAFTTPYGVAGRLLGAGERLLLELSGYAEGRGEVYPEVRLQGRLLPPLPPGLEVPPLAFRLGREGLEVPGVGEVAFREGFPFRLALPFRYLGLEGQLWAQGDLEGGRLRLATPYGEMVGEGPWRGLRAVGGGEVPYLGAWTLEGRADLLALAYRGEVGLPKGDLRLAFSGRGGSLRLLGRAPGLRVLGGYEGGLALLLQAEGYDLAPFGLPARAHGAWGHRGGRLRLSSPYGEALLLGEAPLSARVRFSSPYLRGEGEVSPEGASLRLRGSYRQGGVEVWARGEGGGPWGALRLQVAGEARAPYLDPLPFRGEVWVEGGVRYRVEGPLFLEGEGLAYRGRADLPFALLGRVGRVSGVFQGEGLRLEGEGEGVWAGLPFDWRGAYGEEPSLLLRFSGGEAVLEGGEVGLSLEEVAPLAEALGVALSGSLSARLGLSGEGEGEGLLRYGGEALAVGYRATEVRLFLPGRGLGLAWDWRAGRLSGLGEVSGEGELRLGGGLEGEARGAFRYRGVEVAFGGPLSALGVQARYRDEVLGESWLEGVVDLPALEGEGEVGHASAYAQGEGRFRWQGSRYQAEGHLRGLRYLVQEGPFRLQGEGLWAEAVWEAPLALSARYEGDLVLWARGQAEVEGFRVEADLGYAPEGYRGGLRARGRGLEVEARGEGPLGFRVLGEGLRAEGEVVGLGVSGVARYGRALGQARLEAEGRFSGELPRLALEGEGALVGEGKRLGFAFRYGGVGFDPKALVLWGEGEGYRLTLREGRLSLRLDQDLEPFGLPVRLRASGEGPWEDPLDVVLERPEGRLSGRVWPWPPRAELAGEVLGERVEALYQEGLILRFLGPRLQGEARYGEGLAGTLAFRYPLPEGGLLGEVDLGARALRLAGEGAWQGAWTGSLCLPAPLGDCPGLGLSLEGKLSYRDYAFSGRYAYQAETGYLGEIQGDGTLGTPYGGVRLLGRGLGLDLLGEDLPLRGRLDLLPPTLTYRYEGPLPRGLGELRAWGSYPGEWLSGTYRYGEVALALEGLPGFRVALSGEGVSGEVGPEGVALALSGFRLGPLVLSGQAEGPLSGAALDLSLAAFGREARAVGRLGAGGLALAFSGDLEGQVSWERAWAGRLAFREGWVEVLGEGVPELRGEVLGEGVALRWPRLEMGGLSLDLLSREAQGEARLPWGLAARGEGRVLLLGYRVPALGLPLEGRLDLADLALELASPEGEGALRYGGGEVSGRFALDLGGFLLVLEGAGDRVRIRGEHPAYPWWPAGEGRLEGEVDLGGAYRLGYRAGPQTLTLTGRLLEAALRAEGPYLAGELAHPPKGELRVDLPLPPLESRFGGRLYGEGYRVEGVLAGGVGRIGVRGRLLPLEGELTLEETALEDFLARYAPYLQGRVSGRVLVQEARAQGEVAGFVEVAGTRLPLGLKARLAPGGAEGEGQIGESPFAFALLGDRLDLSASPRAFPLHLLLSAVAGPLEGEAYWTGAVRLRLPLADPRRGEGVLVGESLVFRGGGDELRGRAAFRYGGETLYVDHLRLSGRGLWEGGGYWSPRGSDLYLNLKDTAFTPVLQVIPALRPYRPEASGTLALRLTEGGFQVALEEFRFRLGPVAGYLPKGLLSLNGGAQAEGELTLTAPFPGRGRLGLGGTLEAFQVSARGAVSLPGLREDTPAELTFRYPNYGVEIRLGEAEAQGTLFPLRLAGYGRLPLYYPQYYLQEGLLDIKSFFLYEERGTYHLTGNAEVLRARLAIPEASQRQLSTEGVEVAERPAPIPLVFDGVRLYAERGVLVQESLAQGELRGEVYLGGTYGDPFLTGTVEALWGSFRLWDSLFTLDPAASRLRFAPDRGILPELALKAQAETRGYRVSLEASGEFVREGGRVKVRLEPRFASEPPLSEPEIYALLTLGTPDVARIGETLPQAALGAALESLVLGQLERELAKALGLDRFQVQVPLFGGGELEDIRFSIGKYLSPELFLGYRVDLRGEQTLSAQYRRDGLTFSLGSTFQFGNGRLARLDFALGYDLTPSLGLSLGLEAADTVRFSVGALYRW
ncbi:translocation/assembly module TamB domain-containing protein [Thermus sediminis]|uniref:translocation/assembly module TamB domain-containing protein n=1 Tax=Thermus sediminis TaxID=1761908 RepID=UPI000E3BD6FC|nr:translocation/assembly module TamB domain-containing protein [Thermus sediminis]